MKKTCLLILLLISSIVGFAQLKSDSDALKLKHYQDSAMRAYKQDSAKLKFSFRPAADLMSSGNLSITMEFKNLTDHPIRLLDLFNDMYINFFLVIIDENRKSISPY
ncbi:MAG TPA: hypothetical protein VGI43_09535, partial [Mucilaginibacter sp.]